MSSPSRNQVAQWKPDQMVAAGQQHTALAELLRTTIDHVSRVVHLPGDNGEWSGAACRAAEDRAVSEVQEVRKPAAAVDDLANALTEGGTVIAELTRNLLDNANWAEGEKFVVSDSWNVTDPEPGSDSGRENARANWQASLDSLRSALNVALTSSADKIRAALNEIELAAPTSSARMSAGFQLPFSGLSPSRQRAVDYAEAHWKRYNPNYPDYKDKGSDCANFVSQVLEAGGFKQEMSRDRLGDPNDDDPNAWFSQHDDNAITKDWEASRTWTYAPEQYKYLAQGRGSAEDGTPIGTPAQTASWPSPSSPMDPMALSKSGLEPGDVVYYEKMMPDGKPQISHTAVYVGQDWITQPDGSRVWGDVVNMHTSDRYHEPWYLPRYGDDPGNFPVTYRPVKIHYPDDPS